MENPGLISSMGGAIACGWIVYLCKMFIGSEQGKIENVLGIFFGGAALAWLVYFAVNAARLMPIH